MLNPNNLEGHEFAYEVAICIEGDQSQTVDKMCKILRGLLAQEQADHSISEYPNVCSSRET